MSKDKKECACTNDDCDLVFEPDYEKRLDVIDSLISSLIDKMEEEVNKGSLDSDALKTYSKILKNVTSSKKNILKSDLLSLELEDCLYNDFDDDDMDSEDDSPLEFEEEEITEETEEPKEEKPVSKKRSCKK